MDEDRVASILGLKVHKVAMDAAVGRAREMLAQGGVRQVVTLNAEMAVRAGSDPSLAQVINSADMVVPDGIGVVWASRVLGDPVPGRVAGFDLMQELLAAAEGEGWAVFLLGAAPGVAEEAASTIRTRLPGLRLVGTHHGYFAEAEDRAVVEKVNASGASLVFVAMGSPRQEMWIARNRTRLRRCVCVGVGGSLDVLAGRVSRAPGWVRRVGLEWLYRLAAQPGRFGRMLVLPRFACRVLAQRRARRGVWRIMVP